MHNYHDHHRLLPDSLDDILIGGTTTFDDARDGDKFVALRLTSTAVSLLAEPVPGITGSESLVLDINLVNGRLVDSDIRWFPTPGAAAARQRMFALIDRAQIEAVGSLVGLLPYVEQDDIGLLLPAILKGDSSDDVDAALRSLTHGRGATLSVGDLQGAANPAFYDGSVRLFCDGSARPIFTRFVVEVLRAMQIGAYGEQGSELPAVQLPLGLTHPGAFTCAGLWKAAVVDEALADRGMPRFGRHMSPADAEVIRAYVARQAAFLYEEEQTTMPPPVTQGTDASGPAGD